MTKRLLFGEMMSIVGILTGLIYTPLIYDYVVRNKMGTYVAGAQLVTRLTNLVTVNGAGLFIVGYAALFQPPAGEMVRVVLDQPSTGSEIQRRLAGAAADEDSSPVPGKIHVDVWNANGMVEASGKGMEIRVHNPDSEHLAGKLRNLTGQLNPLVEQQRLATDRAEIESRAGNQASAERFRQQAAKLQEEIAPLQAEIGRLTAELNGRSQAVSEWVQSKLANSLTQPGAFLQAVEFPEVALATFSLTSASAARRIEGVLVKAREQIPELVDLRVSGDGRTLEAAFVASNPEVANRAADKLRTLLQKEGGLIEPKETVWTTTDGIRLVVETVEEPVPSRISPVTRMVRWIQALFGAAPPDDLSEAVK